MDRNNYTCHVKNREEIIGNFISELAVILSKMDEPELVENFLKSILTRTEVSEIALRWGLVKLIDEGRSQRSIARDLGLSLCKITRGSKELQKPGSPFAKAVELFKETTVTEEE